MIYYLITKKSDKSIVSVEQQENPTFIKYQEKNNIMLPTSSQEEAQGILSVDGSVVYQIITRTEIPLDLEYYVQEIYKYEFDSKLAEGVPENIKEVEEEEIHQPPEETEVIPQQNPNEEYEALTKRIAELQAELSAITQLLEEKLK